MDRTEVSKNYDTLFWTSCAKQKWGCVKLPTFGSAEERFFFLNGRPTFKTVFFDTSQTHITIFWHNDQENTKYIYGSRVRYLYVLVPPKSESWNTSTGTLHVWQVSARGLSVTSYDLELGNTIFLVQRWRRTVFVLNLHKNPQLLFVFRSCLSSTQKTCVVSRRDYV